ncbi:MAG: radical SAM protein, partial [Dehalococcoidia bacterium]
MSQSNSLSVNAIYTYTAREAIPLNVLFELTYRCNVHCSHCYVVDRSGVELSFNEIASILRQLADDGCLFLTLTGGEVLLRNDFLEIARYARGLGFALKVFTN